MAFLEPDHARESVRELLQLLSDPAAQRKYERDVPIANVPAELVCMWFDDLYHPELLTGFSESERKALADFHSFFDARVEGLPCDGGVAKLHDAPAWREVMAKAGQALAQFAAAT